jgi:hypothetical protein
MITKGLGIKQKAIIHYLQRRYYIRVFADLGRCEKSVNLCDRDGNETAILSETWLNSLVHRGIIEGKMTYSTVQPDTETWQFRIHPDCEIEKPSKRK